MHIVVSMLYFFFQAEDGIRDYKVTGVQTCALPICIRKLRNCIFGLGFSVWVLTPNLRDDVWNRVMNGEIGRASCRERV